MKPLKEDQQLRSVSLSHSVAAPGVRTKSALRGKLPLSLFDQPPGWPSNAPAGVPEMEPEDPARRRSESDGSDRSVRSDEAD
jgi:hypothetical protein